MTMTIHFIESKRALSELRGFLKTLRHLQTFSEQVSELESLESLAKKAENRLASAEQRVTDAASRADAAEADATRHVASAHALAAAAEADAQEAAETAKRKAAVDIAEAQQGFASELTAIAARRERAEAEAATAQERLTGLLAQIAAAEAQRDQIRQLTEALRGAVAA
jgi:chromosome segregation ATPase